MSKIIYTLPEQLTVSNTTDETDIFTFDFDEYSKFTSGQPAFLGRDAAFRVTIGGSFAENVGTTPSFAFNGYLNSGVISTVEGNNISGFPYFKYVVTAFIFPGRNEQHCTGELLIGSTTGLGGDPIALQMATVKTEDLSAGLNFKTTVTMSQADSNVGWTRTIAYLELL